MYIKELGIEHLEVGEILPRWAGVEACYIDYTDSGFIVYVCFKNMRQEEINDLSGHGNIRFRTAYYGGIIWLFWQCGAMPWNDLAFNYNLTVNKTREIEKPKTEKPCYAVTIVGVEGTTGEIKSLRMVALPEKQSADIYRYCMEQANDQNAPKTQTDNDRRVEEIYSRYNTSQLMKVSKAR